jgi:ankyrin repeat protein
MDTIINAVIEAHNAVLLSRGRLKELIENRKRLALQAMRAYDIFPQFTGDNEDQFDETLVPYYFYIKRIKENPHKTIKEIVGIEELDNISAAFAAFEEYDLMKRYISEGHSFNVQTSVGAFRNWQPTPLYYVTIRKVIENLKDIRKLLTFMVENKADPNMSAGDESTPLLNACYENKPIELMHLLLELNANPNKPGIENGLSWYPLSFCLLAEVAENGKKRNPPSFESIQKAKLLLNYGADPNKGVCNYTPLMQAIITCDHSNIDIIWDLLERGANPNALDDEETICPLLLTYDYNWFEAGQLLLLYNAEMEIVQRLIKKRENQHIDTLKIITTTWFPTGSGKDHRKFKTISYADLKTKERITFDNFHIRINSISDKHLQGSIFWQEQDSNTSITFDCGVFNLSTNNTEFKTESLNISYETYSKLSLTLQLSENHSKSLKSF